MKKQNCIITIVVLLCSIACSSSDDDLVRYVNTLVGTQVWQSSVAVAGHEEPSGYTFPGVTAPFGMTEWTAHTMESKAHGTIHHRVPYWYGHNYISGFLGTHYPSGAVMYDYGAVEIMPITGPFRYRPEERSSAYNHKTEIAKPHYYEVVLDDYNIKTQLSASHSASIMNFTFPASDSAYILVDAMPSLFTSGVPGKIAIDPERREISGTSVLSARAYRESGYFIVQFDKDFECFGTFNQNLDYPEVIESKYLFTQNGDHKVNGLKAVYTQNSSVFGRLRSERIDPVIDFDWDWYKPADDFDFDNYNVTWSGKLVPPVTGEYIIGLQSDDGARLYIDGKLVIDDWAAHTYSLHPKQTKIKLESNHEYDIKIDYYQNQWSSKIKLSWIIPDARSREPIIKGNRELERSTKIGAYIGFKTKNGEVVTAKVGTSFISIEQARANLEREIGSANLETVRHQTAALWNKELSAIELPEASNSQKEVFYTALYHSLLLPRSLSENGRYRSPFDGKTHEGFSFTDYSLWDTFRATHPLFTLLKPDFAGDIITGLLHAYDEGGWLPKWPNPGYTNCMLGTHSDAVIADAYMKGIKNFDIEKATQAMLKNAYTKGDHIAWGRLGILEYIKYGYVPIDMYRESIARTMEFAYDDFCLAQFFQKKGEEKKAAEFYQRSQNFKNVLDDETHLVRGRNSNGTWAHPDDYAISVWSGFNKQGVNNYRMNYTLFAPHNVEEIMHFLGGADSLSVFLDKIFDNDIYYVGDEFAMHAPYMYNCCGQPWMTQKRINEIVHKYYLPLPSGLPGNDDCGQLSSWYIFSAMGFYPMCPGKAEYQIGVPCLPQIVLHLSRNKRFIIKTRKTNKNSTYIQSVTLNGQPHKSTVLRHEDIMNGGELVFVLGDQPNKTWFHD
jgi:putative alpha-1,2-mannosidase